MKRKYLISLFCMCMAATIAMYSSVSTASKVVAAPVGFVATPAPGIPGDVAKYLADAGKYTLAMGEAMGNIGDLFAEPNLTSSLWMTDLALNFYIVQQGHQILLLIKPPPAMSSIHTQVLAMSQDCNDATVAITDGIDNRNQYSLETGMDLLASCDKNARQAKTMLDSYLASRAVPTSAPNPTLKSTPTPTTSGTVVLRNANLRSGPGTTFAVVGSATAGQKLILSGRNAEDTWYKLKTGEWIAAFLVTGAPGNLPIVK